MKEWTRRLVCAAALVIGSAFAYEVYAYMQAASAVKKAVERCSVRTSGVLSHTDYEFSDLSKTIRCVTEAMAYVDGVIGDVHVHTDGTVHFHDESSFRYLKLCADTLRSEKNLAEAVERYAMRLGKEGGSGLTQAETETLREESYTNILRKRAEMRELLTELRNENEHLTEGRQFSDVLVNIGSIEHAEKEIDAIYSRL